MTEKQQLYNFCRTFIDDRIARIQKNIAGIQESLTSETKSSAGDKHETGRAMLQLEREKLGQQLSEAEKTKQLLSKVSIDQNSTTVGLGSLVQTTTGNYFIAISAGEIKIDQKTVYCISAITPIGKAIFGKSVGDTFSFNQKKGKIESIF